MIKKIKKSFDFLLGNALGLTMENVIFNGICLIVLIYLWSMVAFNFFYAQYFLGEILLSTSLALIIVYFLSRFKGKFILGYFLFGFISCPLIAVNFYLNDGIAGPSAYVLLMIHIIMMALSPGRYYSFWLVYNALFFTLLFYIGIYHSDLIPKNYFGVDHKFWDHMVTYWISIVGIFAIIYTIKKFYLLQKEQTETKSMELLEANHKLRNSNDQKNKIIAVISHDLRSPLNSIFSILEFVQAGELDEEEMAFVRKELLTMTSHTTKMLDDILDWASFEMQNNEINITESDIKSACENVLAIFSILANHKNITFKTEYIDNPTVNTDMGRVLLIVRNLIQNAIKFTPKGGEISFVVQQVEDKVQISISDTGIGFSSEKLEKLFLLDIKATYGTEKEKGTGLGLYLSRGNAKKIDADISVQVEEGKGSTFTLTLPLFLNIPSN